MRLVIGIGIVLISISLCFPALSTEQRRLALVIGNDDYQKVSKLKKAVNDADAMAGELKAAGFAVVQYHNLDYQDMVKAVESFANRVNGGDQVVVFFAGHGVQIKTGGYLLPVDIEAGSERQVEKTSYGLADLTDRLSEAKPSFTLVVVDACRDNPLKSRGRSIGNTRGLSAIEPPKGQMVVYSASKGQQALDRLSEEDESPNSVFTRAFIARMKKPGVRIEEMMREVQDAVEKLAQSVDHEQRPAIYNESRGNFYFFGPTTVNVQTFPPPLSHVGKSQSNALVVHDDTETYFWNDVKAGGSREYFDAYLKKYPNGKYVDLARIELKKMADREKTGKGRENDSNKQTAKQLEARIARIELESWEQAKSGNSISAYDDYLSRYPEGQFAALAQAARKKLVQEAAERERQAREEAASQEMQARKKREAEARVARIEQESWEQAQSVNSISAYDDYLSRYPVGRFVALAQGVRKKLVQEAAELERQAREEAASQEMQARKKREAEARVARIEQESWGQAQSVNSISAYDDYLSRYPEGRFGALAQAARQKLVQESAERERQAREEAVRQEEQARKRREAEARAARIEQESWEQAKSGNSISAYDDYLSRYPDGQFVALAQGARQKLVQEAAELERQVREEAVRQEEQVRKRREAEARAARIEQESWEQTKSVNSISVYDDYLIRYPDGRFAALAQEARQKLVQEAEALAAKIEQESWELAKSENNLSVYENFLSRYPKGRFSVKAQGNYQILLKQKREEEARMMAVQVEQETWELAKSENSVSAYDNYLNKYPDGRFADLCRVASQKILRDDLVYAAKNLFAVTADGVISDAQSGLEWVAGPDENTDYSQAEKWVVTCGVAGGGWRMPTMLELKELYAKGVDTHNFQQIFKTSGAFVWGEPKDWLSAWNFNFRIGKEQWDTRYDSANNRVFGVRARQR
ncbi:MAG: hypothetical protein A2512_09085 [Deltaproteobacteria bacterium RIFOXYD12_FULL_56_24]|nr:MAG: hypothetical protein A2512_09085 [Deltaproteobacteria bacterium RIFOXYD12_FULL_56_24]